MAKDFYKIPESLDKTVGDMEISLKSSDGIGAKPTPVKILLAYIISGLLCFYLLTSTFIGKGGLFLNVLFVILWATLTRVLLLQDKTGLPQASLVITLFNYIPKQARYLITRTTSRANPFAGVVGLHYDSETGLINYDDGCVGCIYRVVGNGSILLFDEDRKAVLNRVDQFHRKMKTDTELIFITSKESQKIYRQVGSLSYRAKHLKNKDKDLLDLIDMQYNNLKNDVGGTYRSIHQYMVVRSENKESLMIAKNIILSEIENSQLMLKQCVELSGEDGHDVFRVIFQGKESV